MTRSAGIMQCVRGTMAALAVTVMACGSATVAVAQDDNDRLDDAWADLVIDQEPILSESQFAQLNNLAYQAAVTRICDGYALDQTAFSEGLAAAMAEQPTEADQDGIREWEAAVLFRIGATYGLFLAEGNARPDGFCASAAALRADAEVPNVWQ
ncbi:MAG: hypothetical protein GY798_07285 [Hyphomicrobiales bacterium]|nr:hypothetical protein [Hyphomicrobiales bacterium]